jgi:NADH:ubiquinone oxidoreductase subunit F (NADH-binding)
MPEYGVATATQETTPAKLPRLLAGIRRGRPQTLAEHQERLGGLPGTDSSGERSELLGEVERSGLRGRGGAGFPVAVKMRAVGSRSGPRLLVANGSEGEPASRKDTLLMARAPHLVLDGATLAAGMVRANEAIVCVKGSSEEAAASLLTAVQEREDAGIDEARVVVRVVSSEYVAGEESALVHQLNGGDAKPTFIPPRPFEAGVGQQPTLLQNVETLAHLALIARFGAEWFREVGTPDDPGSVLITLSGGVTRPGVYEIAAGTRLGELVKAAGGPTDPVQAFLIGGYAGTWFDVQTALDVPLDHQTLRGLGSTLGPGVVFALPEGACGVVETASVAEYMARASSGQCGPCVHGLAAIAEALLDIASGRAAAGTHEWVARWSEDVRGRGACHHPDGAARLVASCLDVFGAEIDRHERGRPCIPAPGMRELLPTNAARRRPAGITQ